MPATVRRPGVQRHLLWFFLALVLVTFLVPAAHLLGQWNGGWTPSGDDAVIEHVTRQVGRSAVDTGVYSRFGWHHPGPALFYLLAGPYRLTGSSSAALPVTALLVNAACVVAFALLLRRRAGTAVSIWGLLVLAVYLRRLPVGFVREDWNPFLALLPFLVLVLVCWCVVLGDRWLLPAAAALGSFCVQCHIGYAIGVAAVWGATLLGLAAGAIRWRRPVRWRRWLPISAGTLLVLALFWVLPLVDELTGHPGNLTLLARYFRAQRPSWTLHEAVRQLATTIGWLPGWLTGQHLRSNLLAPALLPTWTGAVAIAAFVAAVAVTGVRVAMRRRAVAGTAVAPELEEPEAEASTAAPAPTEQSGSPRLAEPLGLAVVVCVVGAASLVATVRVVGPLYTYLVQWIWTVGVLAWVLVGMIVIDVLRGVIGARSSTDHSSTRRSRSVVRVVGLATVPALALAALSVATGWRAARDTTATIPAIRPLSSAVTDWLHGQHATIVTVRYAPTTKPVFVGTLDAGNAMVLALERSGFDVQMSRADRNVFGKVSTDHPERARAAVVVGFADGFSPPPGPGEVLLGRSGGYQVIGVPLH